MTTFENKSLKANQSFRVTYIGLNKIVERKNRN